MNRLNYMEFYITNVCNLTCTGCNRFNNYKFKGFQRWADYKEEYTQWSKEFLSQWKIKNNTIYEEYKNLFSWTPNWCPPDGWSTVDITENIHE